MQAFVLFFSVVPGCSQWLKDSGKKETWRVIRHRWWVHAHLERRNASHFIQALFPISHLSREKDLVGVSYSSLPCSILKLLNPLFLHRFSSFFFFLFFLFFCPFILSLFVCSRLYNRPLDLSIADRSTTRFIPPRPSYLFAPRIKPTSTNQSIRSTPSIRNTPSNTFEAKALFCATSRENRQPALSIRNSKYLIGLGPIIVTRLQWTSQEWQPIC
jgi:hypothetical protein